MLQTCGRIPLGLRSSMRWRRRARSASVSLSFARGIRNKLRPSLSLDNWRRSHLWVWAEIVSSTPYSYSDRWLHTSMRVQAFLWTHLLILGEEPLPPLQCTSSPFQQPSSAMRTLITTRVRCVTKSVRAWPAHVCIPASDSVTNPAETAGSQFLM